MGKKILIVDDEKEICELVCEGLRNAGYDAVFTTASDEALDIASKEKPDLVILDIHMPRMDGVSIYERLRKDAIHRYTPIIFLTVLAQGSRPRLAGLKNDDAYSVIPKPATIEQVESEVERLLRQRASFKS